MKKRIMRKRIPYGIYCVEGCDKDGRLAQCPWFKFDKKAQMPRCAYLHMTSDRDTDLLWDGCKECGIHEDADGKIERRIMRKQKKAQIRNVKGKGENV